MSDDQRWEPLQPIVMLATGVRDQTTRTTYQPFSCKYTGAIGYRVKVDGRQAEPRVYMIPSTIAGMHEIRFHASDSDPDPAIDPLLGVISLPDDWR